MLTHRWPSASPLIRCADLQLLLLLLLSASLHGQQFYEVSGRTSSCYDDNGLPMRCSPDFINAAFNRPFTASNTCGEGSGEYCARTSEYLTDYNNQANLTWWQSESMLYDVQYPNSVNLTLNLGKSFDITYIKINFHSSRPESFAIYKRTNESEEWVPYQYFSSNCEHMYGKSSTEIITRDNEAVALCTDEYSDIVPLSGGSILFSTLEGRPNAYYFENSEVLKEFVTATDIRITLNRLNTYGNEVFNDPRVLSSYFYAISDIAVGGRCKCNGHADRCVTFQDSNFEDKYKCVCEHNTDGVDCERCLPFYNNKPWRQATLNDANVCQMCNCSGLSDTCVFNQTLYDATGQGGCCTNCQRNTEGCHCEACKYGFYRSENNNECVECRCHKDGALHMQCDPSGICPRCKPGVTGDKCDRCLPNHYDLTAEGCKPCNCNAEGSFDSPAICDSRSGKCRCKQNVEGNSCDRCKSGFYYLNGNLSAGCLSCHCFGHSADCVSSTEYVLGHVESSAALANFAEWTAIDAAGQTVFAGVQSNVSNDTGLFVYANEKDVWFNLPAKYLGNQLKSYSRSLSFTLRTTLSKSSTSRKDIVLESSALGLQVHASFYDELIKAQPTLDNLDPAQYSLSFVLIEDRWKPAYTAADFQRLLSNLTAVRIKANGGSYTFINDVRLETAQRAAKARGGSGSEQQTSPVALWVEQCACPGASNTAGQHCERCAVGFRRATPYADAYARCVPCSCNNHSVSCEPASGRCQCIHHTEGENCEACVASYYGNALVGTPLDCKKCICPHDGPCAEFYNYQSGLVEVVCLDCPVGTRGNMCDMCDDGYYEKPQSTAAAAEATTAVGSNDGGASLFECARCTCNGNIDANAVGNCDSRTGACLRCVHNTTGDACERCLPSHWGDALSDTKCHACDCDAQGASGPECSLSDGQCACRPHVTGRTCAACRDTYWNLSSGAGCTACACNPLGSLSLSCDQATGVCQCRAGVTGAKCDQCLPNYYGFGPEGCAACACNPLGALGAQCDFTGRCACRANVAGAKCDRCAENYANFSLGCRKCEDCYNLVQGEVGKLRAKIAELDAALAASVVAKSAAGGQGDVQASNKELENKLAAIKTDVDQAYNQLFDNQTYDLFKPTFEKSVKHLDEVIAALNVDFARLQKPLDTFGKKLDELNRLDTQFNSTIQDSVFLPTIILQLREDLTVIKDTFAEVQTAGGDAHATAQRAKLRSLAISARRTATQQQTAAADFRKTLDDYLAASRKSLVELDDIAAKSSAAVAAAAAAQRGQPEFDHEQATRRIVRLRADVTQTRTALDAQLLEVEAAITQLATVNIQDADFERDIEQIGRKTEEFDAQVKSARTKIDQLNAVIANATTSASSELQSAHKSLNSVKLKDADLSQLLEKSERARNTSDRAVQTAVDAFANATAMLHTLENFDTVLAANKARADQATGLRSEVDTNNEESKRVLAHIDESFRAAKRSLMAVTGQVETTNATINSRNKNSAESLQRSQQLAMVSTNLSTRAVDLANRFTNYNESIVEASVKARELPVRLQNLADNITLVTAKSQNLLLDVESNLDGLSLLVEKNITFTGVTQESIDILSAKFGVVVAELEQLTAIDSQLADLAERYDRDHERLKSYEREVPHLRKHVADLSSLKESIQLHCAKRA